MVGSFSGRRKDEDEDGDDDDIDHSPNERRMISSNTYGSSKPSSAGGRTTKTTSFSK